MTLYNPPVLTSLAFRRNNYVTEITRIRSTSYEFAYQREQYLRITLSPVWICLTIQRMNAFGFMRPRTVIRNIKTAIFQLVLLRMYCVMQNQPIISDWSCYTKNQNLPLHLPTCVQAAGVYFTQTFTLKLLHCKKPVKEPFAMQNQPMIST